MTNRKASNYHYNTEGLFSSQYNENTAIHGVPKYNMPDLMKINNGSAVSQEPRINVASGDYTIANNGPYFEDIYTKDSYANGRQTMVDNMSIIPVNDGFRKRTKENWTPPYTDFTSQLSPDMGMSSAGKTNTYLTDNVCTKEKFFGINTESDCFLYSVIFGILFVIFIVWGINKLAKEQTGKKIFKGGYSTYTFTNNRITKPITRNNNSPVFSSSQNKIPLRKNSLDIPSHKEKTTGGINLNPPDNKSDTNNIVTSKITNYDII